MEDVKQFELQKHVRENCEDFRNTLNDLYKWEQEIKEKEKLENDDIVEKYPEVRSHQNDQQNGNIIEETGKGDGHSGIPPFRPESEAEASGKKLASENKEKGNYYVKLGDYENAIYYYTEAIINDDTDPIYYTNRALCYLKLEKYEFCINDCNKAISISPNTVKGFYRRMQAYESLGENEKALADCNKVLSLEPKNVEAKKSLERIKKRKNSFAYNLSKSFKSSPIVPQPKIPTWTKVGGNIKAITVDAKPAHLRSKASLKRIDIEEFISASYIEKDNKNAENSNRMNYSDNISDEIIDKLFNSNDCGSYRKVEKKESTADIIELKRNDPKKEKQTKKIEIKTKAKENIDLNENVILKPDVKLKSIEEKVVKANIVESIKETKVIVPPEKFKNLPAPKSQGQFYSTWKELSLDQKYLYFKQIETNNINKILGACFEIETLSEILVILNKYYVQDNCNVGKVLLEISKHEGISILAFFLSDEDRNALKDLLSYMKSNKDAEEDIEFVSKKFNVKY